MIQSILRAGALLITTLTFGCSSSSSPAAGPADASSGFDATGGADSSSGSDASSASDANIVDAAKGDEIPSIDAAGIVAARPYTMHVPAGYDPSKPAPLLVMFHGYGYSGDVQESYFQLGNTSDVHGFLYAYSDGTMSKPPDGGPGGRFWNATNACCDFYDPTIDDVQYFDAIVEDIEAKYKVDPRRIFVVGHSNGGFMSHRLACDRASRVAAIVSLAGAQWEDLGKCTPSGPVSVAQVHGSANQTIAYDGGITQGGTYPAAPTTVADWGTRNGCTGALIATGQTLDIDSQLPGNETQVQAYQGCPAGIDVQLWTIQGGTHFPTMNQPAWGETVWSFLSAHPKP